MKLVPMSVTRVIGRNLLVAKKNSPHIFFVGGIVGVVGSTFLACRATLKLEPVLDEIKNDLDSLKILKVTTEDNNHDYDQRDYIRDLGYVYGKSANKLGRLYGPSIVLGVASISALTGSHVQMTRRNAALTATIAAVSKAYEDYRVRVQEELGKDKELELYRNVKEHEIKDENGNKKSVKIVDSNGFSPYARIFDEANVNWQKDAELNRIFIQCQQNYANHLLTSRGHVFLNDVYDAFGFERTRPGAVVGWLRDGDGDGFVDFNMFDHRNLRFLNGTERNVWLDFNVDGVIYDKI